MDVLSDVLRVIRISGAALFRGEFSAPWCVEAPPAREVAPLLAPGAARVILFHVVAEGTCWVQRHGSPPLELVAGDVIMVPQGDAHTLADAPGREATPIAALLPPPPWAGLPRLTHGGSGPATRILCGFLHSDEAFLHPLLTTLPALLCVRSRRSEPAPRLETLLRYTLEEATSGRPGGACMLTRLTDVLIVEILRRYMEELPTERLQPWVALDDPVVRHALELLHAEPARAWTLHELARGAGASRSVLAERFKALTGCTAMQYLTRWRLQVAVQRLRESRESTARVAAAVGYESEAAFSRAFKRHLGEPPATWRRHHGQPSSPA